MTARRIAKAPKAPKTPASAGPRLYTDIPYEQRFTEALEFITGHKPPPDAVKSWLDPNGEGDLQQWVGYLPGIPDWLQNIAVLDAARVMADQPCEGEI